jgi:hypothetical protein
LGWWASKTVFLEQYKAISFVRFLVGTFIPEKERSIKVETKVTTKASLLAVMLTNLLD